MKLTKPQIVLLNGIADVAAATLVLVTGSRGKSGVIYSDGRPVSGAAKVQPKTVAALIALGALASSDKNESFALTPEAYAAIGREAVAYEPVAVGDRAFVGKHAARNAKRFERKQRQQARRARREGRSDVRASQSPRAVRDRQVKTN